MRPMILWGVTLSVVFVMASCRERLSPAPTTPADTAKTYRTRDGLQITPLDVERNELADILDVQMWRFRIVRPSPDAHIRHAIEIREAGQSPKEIYSATMWGPTISDSEVVVALYPVGGQVTTADKLRTYVRIGGGSSGRFWDNPLRELAGQGFSRSPKPPMQDDESFVLMEFSKSGHYPDPNNTLLVLTLHVAEKQG